MITDDDLCITCVTPSFLQASKKFSTFLRHLAMLSFGWSPEKWIMLAFKSKTDKKTGMALKGHVGCDTLWLKANE